MMKKYGKDIESVVSEISKKLKLKVPKCHKKGRVYLIFDTPVDVFPHVVALVQCFCQHEKRIMLSAVSKEPINIKTQERMRDAIHKVLTSPDADLNDILNAYEEFAGMKIPRKEQLRYIG